MNAKRVIAAILIGICWLSASATETRVAKFKTATGTLLKVVCREDASGDSLRLYRDDAMNALVELPFKSDRSFVFDFASIKEITLLQKKDSSSKERLLIVTDKDGSTTLFYSDELLTQTINNHDNHSAAVHAQTKNGDYVVIRNLTPAK